MQTTSNYKLKKPDGTDPVEIQDFNDNADILDAELAKRAGKATATTGADGLMSKTDKSKLDGIAAGANNYTHPATHPASMISQDASNRFTSDSEKLTWNNHVNGRSNPHGITPLQIGAATTSEVADLKKSVSDGKQKVAAAITAKGQSTAQDAAFDLMATNINKIQTGVDTSSATATESDIVLGKNAYVKGNKITGNIENRRNNDVPIEVTSITEAWFNFSSISFGNTGCVINTSSSLMAPTYYIASKIGLTSEKLAAGNTVCGVVGTYGGLVKVPNQMPLSAGRRDLVATTVGDYALFGGGRNSGSLSTVDAYNRRLVRSTPSTLSVARHYLAATTVGDYALFGGGSNNSDVVDAFNRSLVRITPTKLSIVMTNLAATTVGDYALFGGGNALVGVVNSYNRSLVRNIPANLAIPKSDLAATTVGDYALFGGGYSGEQNSNTVESYNRSLVRSIPDVLSVARYWLAATTIGDYALFGGGSNPGGSLSMVDAYNRSLVRSTPTALSVPRNYLAATTIGDYALFGGGNSGGQESSIVDAYNWKLTRSNAMDLTIARGYLAATTVGDYALFGGGSNPGGSLSTVDAYSIVK